MADPGPGTRHSGASVPASGSIGLPMALYALATGILAVSAGTLVQRAGQWGPLTQAVSLFVTVAITVVAGVGADPALRWLLRPAPRPAPRRSQTSAPPADRRP